jgi:two-component system, cell cycle response regulator
MKVLVVEDDAVSRLLLIRALNRRGFDVTACASAEEAMKAYETTFFPLLFLDIYLPGMDGLSFCKWVRRQSAGDDHLIVVGTSSDQAGNLQKVLEAGADDYIVKPYQPEALDVRLTIAQQQVKNKELRRTLEKNLHQERERYKHLATHDTLTTLCNRSAFLEVLQQSVEAARKGVSSALVYVDLDNFKFINDSFGHASGDMVLFEVAALLKDCVRSQDLPARLGGDEFAVLFQGIDLAEATAIAERIRRRMESLHFTHSTRPFGIVASIGLAMIDGSALEKDVMAFADSACYGAKICQQPVKQCSISARLAGRMNCPTCRKGDRCTLERHGRRHSKILLRQSLCAINQCKVMDSKRNSLLADSDLLTFSSPPPKAHSRPIIYRITRCRRA